MNAQDLAAVQTAQIEEYIEMLFLGNEKANLTAFKNRDEVLEKGVYPSFSAAEFLKGGTVVDIGSGGGIPAIPLAIAKCADRWILLEPVGKKASFLEECASRLGLPLEVIRLTGEDYLTKSSDMFDGITLRGVKIRPRLLKLIRKRLKHGAPFLLWTGGEREELYKKELAACGFKLETQKDSKWSTFIASVPCGT
jgi:16S rRNA (guanine527-N7)-methyltransferase